MANYEKTDKKKVERFREIKIDATHNSGFICCTELAKAKKEFNPCTTLDGEIIYGQRVPHAEIVDVLDEAGYIYRGEDICTHNGKDVQAQAFCNDCPSYLLNFIRRVHNGDVPLIGMIADHKQRFKKVMRKLFKKEGKTLKTNAPDRTKVYLVSAGDYWNKFNLLSGINVTDVIDEDNLECILYGTINTSDKEKVLIVQIEKEGDAYSVSSSVVKGDKTYNVVKKVVSEDCIQPMLHTSLALDALIALDLEKATV